MPLYIAKSGDLDRCYRCLTDWLTDSHLKDRATQLLIKYKSGALVTQYINDGKKKAKAFAQVRRLYCFEGHKPSSQVQQANQTQVLKNRCDVEISTFCPGKEKQDMTRTMVVGGTCQALSSPTTSTGTLSAPAVLINQLLAGRKGENLVRGEELQLYSSDLNNYRLRGTWTGTQSSNNNRRSYFWSDYNMISFLFYIRKQTTLSKYSCYC